MKPNKFQVMPWLFLVKINKQDQKNFKEKVSANSPFFMPIGQIHNARNMEHGEIVQIGEWMRGTGDYEVYEKGRGIYGWEKCEVGMILIFHHTIEQHETDKDKTAQYFVFDDEMYNYYVVDSINVRGFYDGKTVTPHPNFVFLKNVPAFPEDGELDATTGNKLVKSKGGLFLIAKWDESHSNIAQKSERIKEHIESLAKSTRTDQIQREMERLEEERNQLNRKAQKKKYLPYQLAYANRKLERDFGRKLYSGDIIYAFNKACLYITNFQIEEYGFIIALVDHVGLLIEDKKNNSN